MKEKRYFIELVVKDSDTLQPVRGVSTSSDYPDSFFNYPPHHNVINDINGCIGILFSMPLKKGSIRFNKTEKFNNLILPRTHEV